MRLFLVVLGGRVDGCHIELHDVRFVAGATLDDTLPQLRQQWFGRRRGLHIDSWVAVQAVAGWRLELRPEPFAGPQRLWFVNVGGYDPLQMAELHAFTLLVAPSAKAAKAQAATARARRQLLPGASQRHTDDLHGVQELGPPDDPGPLEDPAGVDDCLAIERAGGLHVHLIADPAGCDPLAPVQPLVPDWFGYRRIDRP